MKGFYNWASENRKKMKLCELKMLTPFPHGSFPLPLAGQSMDNDTAALERFLGRNVLFERKSVQMWDPALGAIRCLGEIISQRFLLEF